MGRGPKKTTYRWSTDMWKGCSVLLIIREMQIKTRVSYHFTPAEWLSSKRQEITSGGCGEKGTLVHCWRECNKLVQPLWRTVWRVLKKSTVELAYDPAIPLLPVYPKEVKSGSGRDTCTAMFTAVLFTGTKTWKQPKCPSADEWVKKTRCMCTVGHYTAFKRRKSCHLQQCGKCCSPIDLKGFMLSEISQTWKENKLHDLIYGI